MHFHMSVLNSGVVRERNAKEFWASPATATNRMSSCADGFSSISSDNFTGCKEVRPPTVPSASGISSQNLKNPGSIAVIN
jgi:hypothetical protein